MKYRQIIKQSLSITKKQKALWLYGLILAIFPSKGRNLNFRVPADNLSLDQFTPTAQQVVSTVTNFIASIPVSTWVLLGTTILITSLIFFLLRLFINQWALGSLIGGITLALDKTPPTVRSASVIGLKSAAPLMILKIIPWFIYWFIVILAFALAIPIFNNAPFLIKILVGIFLSIAAFTYFTAGLFFMITAMIISQRAIVIKGFRFIPAWKFAVKIVKTNWRVLLSQLLINLILKLALFMFWLTILGLLIFFGFFLYRQTIGFFIVFVTFSLLSFISLSIWLTSVVKVFFESIWTIIYHKIT